MNHKTLVVAALGTLSLLAGPVSAQQINPRDGLFNIVGEPGVEERTYGETRGWQVVSGFVRGRFAYCAAEINRNGTGWRVGYDRSPQWQLAFTSRYRGETPYGRFQVDRQRSGITGWGNGQWVVAFLNRGEYDAIGHGNLLDVRFDRAHLTLPLNGSAAALTKVDECVARTGVPPHQAAPGFGGARPETQPQFPRDDRRPGFPPDRQPPRQPDQWMQPGNPPQGWPQQAQPRPQPRPQPPQVQPRPQPQQPPQQAQPRPQPAPAPVVTACSNPNNLRPTQSSVPARVEFVNDRTRASVVYAIDESGRQVLAGRLDQPGATLVLDTYETHVFVAFDEGGACIGGVYYAQGGHNQFVLH